MEFNNLGGLINSINKLTETIQDNIPRIEKRMENLENKVDQLLIENEKLKKSLAEKENEKQKDNGITVTANSRDSSLSNENQVSEGNENQNIDNSFQNFHLS